MNKNEFEEMRQALGATAEMALIFFRAALGAGATVEEAVRTTQAFLSALLPRPHTPPEEDA